jgi:hypothetical protein
MDKATERMVRLRAGEYCEYCRLPELCSKLKFTIDHIRAKQHGGSDEAENLALSCGYCNRHKGPNIAGIDPASGQMTRLFNPRSDSWTEHFTWDGPRINRVTAMGRTTVVVLALNSREQLSIRQALLDEGDFSSVE